MNYSQDNNKKRLRKYKSQGKKVKNKVGFIFLRVLVSSILIGIFALAGAGIGAYFSIIQGAPPLDVLSFNLLEGSFDSVILDAHGNELARLEGGVNRVFAEWDEIPEHVINAFVAIEDERFWEHNGVDAQGMVRAVYQTLFRGNTQGASTITQQLIKNQLDLRRNTIETKLQEQILAVQFEAMLVEELGSQEAAKQRILHLYLNEIYLGSGNQGVQAASWFYFNKSVSELTLSEAAVIAAITQWPWAHNPLRFPEGNRPRQVAVLDSMLRLGYITEEEHAYAVADDPFARIRLVADEIHDTTVWIFFVDAVIERLFQDFMAQGLDRREAERLIFHGGLRIYTTMDPRVQDILDETFLNEEHFPTNPQDFEYHLTYIVTIRSETTGHEVHRQRESHQWGRRVTSHDMFEEFRNWAEADMLGMDDYIVSRAFFYAPQPQSSMVIIDHNTGHVLGMAGQRGEKQTNRALNRATNTTRQPGSVFKIFASFAPAFDVGLITAATVYDDVPHIITEHGVERVWPSNWWVRQAFPYRGLNNVRTAIADSHNVIAVRNIMAVGTHTAHNYLRRFGFTTITDAEAYNPAMALGGLTHGVTNIELTAAMGAIANGGVLQPTILYTLVVDMNGEILIDNRNLPGTQVLNRDAAYMLIDTMRSVITHGTGGSARFQNITMDNAGKTGTTQEGRDLYYTGSTPHLTASVWVGHDRPRPLTTNVTSVRPDTRIWRYVMERIHVELDLPTAFFQQPPGFERVQVCSVSGRLPIPGVCTHDPRGNMTITELFAPGTAPTTTCHIHQVAYVNTVTGMLASEWCPADQVVRRVGFRRDRSWMEVAGNVAIRDAAHELPWQVCNVHNALNSGITMPDTDDWEEDDASGPGGLFINDDDNQGGSTNPSTNPNANTHAGGNPGVNTAAIGQTIPDTTPFPTPTPMPERTPIPPIGGISATGATVDATPTPTPTAGTGTGPTIGTPGGR